MPDNDVIGGDVSAAGHRRNPLQKARKIAGLFLSTITRDDCS